MIVVGLNRCGASMKTSKIYSVESYRIVKTINSLVKVDGCKLKGEDRIVNSYTITLGASGFIF